MTTTDPSTLVFLDETHTPTDLTPLCARAKRGQRAYGRVPRGRRTQVSLLATLTPTGLGPGLHLRGAFDRTAFDQFVAELLVPSLTPGQTVVLDNLPTHKSATAQRLIEAAGCQLVFLPTYSPDFNPIEQAFAKLKAALRREEPRTVEAVMTATEQHYHDITPADARGYYQKAGYNL